MKITVGENGCVIHNPIYTNHFHSRGYFTRKVIETVFAEDKTSAPTGLVWYTAVSLAAVMSCENAL